MHSSYEDCVPLYVSKPLLEKTERAFGYWLFKDRPPPSFLMRPIPWSLLPTLLLKYPLILTVSQIHRDL